MTRPFLAFFQCRSIWALLQRKFIFHFSLGTFTKEIHFPNDQNTQNTQNTLMTSHFLAIFQCRSSQEHETGPQSLRGRSQSNICRSQSIFLSAQTVHGLGKSLTYKVRDIQLCLPPYAFVGPTYTCYVSINVWYQIR